MIIPPAAWDFYLGDTVYANRFQIRFGEEMESFIRKAIEYCHLYKIPPVNFKKLFLKVFEDEVSDLDNFFKFANRDFVGDLPFGGE